MSPSAEKDEPGASSIVTHEHAPPASDPPPPAADPRGIVTASTPHQGAGGSAKKKKKEAEHVGAVEVPFATAQKHDTEEIAWFSQQRRNRYMLLLSLVLVIGSFVAVVIPVPPRGSNGKGSSERGEASTSCVGYEACSGDTGTGSCVGPSACRGSTSLTVSEGSCIGKSNFLME